MAHWRLTGGKARAFTTSPPLLPYLSMRAGAKSVPFPSVVADGKLRPPAELQQVFKDAGVDISQPLVGSCGSGLTACILALAVHRASGGKTLVGQNTARCDRVAGWRLCLELQCAEGASE